ncbi:B-type cyclin [Gnomoniopsis sp. IMI 355080]|nr:B-type cyclin [Gnomoniopsis sp. IMI 355080]
MNPSNVVTNQFDAQLIQPTYLNGGGFKGPAKRSAFGDLSNTAYYVHQGLPANGAMKHTLPTTKPTLKMAPYVDGDKENTVKNGKTKDAFLRPPQRPLNGLKSSSIAQGRPQPDLRAQTLSKQTGAKKATIVYNDVQQQKVQTLSRQYRSQPQLKSAEAPVLRRAQSKHVMQGTASNAIADEGVNDALYEDAIEFSHVPVETDDDWKPQPCPVEPSVTAEINSLEPNSSSGPVLPIPEAEEYWDEDDEEELYDDQGYTTAHSYRSYGDNTTGATCLVNPKRTVKVLRELEEARVYVAANRTPEDIEDEEWDTTMVAEYGDDIFEYMRELEERMIPNPVYMDAVQVEIQWSMRSILMDWLVQVHNRFALLPETLFLTVNFIDRFLSKKMVSLGKLQLVGATAIFVAAKYEEINCPSVQEIVFMVDGGYTVDEILKAERFMLSMLQFELGWPGPMSFLRRISKADDYDLETRTLAKYFLEVTIMDERFVGCTPSYLAAGAHCLARLILKKGDWVSSDPTLCEAQNKLELTSLWSLAHIHYSGYTWAQVKPLVAMVLECCRSPQKHHAAVYEKYCDRRYKKSSIFVQDELAKGFMLPFHNDIPRLSLCSPMDEHSAQMRFPPPENQGVLIATES